MSDPNDMITVREAAQRKGVVRQRIYQLIEQGRLARKVGKDGVWRVSAAEVDDVAGLERGPRKRTTPVVQ